MDELLQAVREHPLSALTAPPGSGKTLYIPTALLEQGPFRNVLVLEPRRVTARLPALAVREVAGNLAGYRIRFESLWDNAHTRVGYLTYGTALRTLLSQPPGPDDLVIFDEFHERSWESEVLLAFLRELPKPPRILLMSATLDESDLPSGTPVVRSDGRLHPVQVTWETREPQLLGRRDRLARLVADRSAEFAAAHRGEQLIFLPGLGDIRAVEEFLRADPVSGPIDILHSSLPESEIRRVVDRPARGFRRILSTDLAESSVTLPGVTVVIDAGLVRRPLRDELDLGNTLQTAGAPQSALAQRAGRAGRLGPGFCHRLFTRQDELHRPKFPNPELEGACYKTIALFLASCGRLAGWRSLPWLHPPDKKKLDSARQWSAAQGLLTAQSELTRLGSQVLQLPLEPRSATFCLRARAGGLPVRHIISLCQALESPPTSGRTAELEEWARLIESDKRGDKRLAAQLQHALKTVPSSKEATLTEVLLLTYSDTLAQVSPERAVCANPQQPALEVEERKDRVPHLAVLLGASGKGGSGPRSFATLYHPIPEELVWEELLDQLEESTELLFEGGTVRSETTVRIGQIVLDRSVVKATPGPEVAALLLNRLTPEELGPEVAAVVRRLRLFFTHRPESLDEVALHLSCEADIESVLRQLHLSFFMTVESWTKSSPEALASHLQQVLPYSVQTALNKELPTHIHMPRRRRPVEVRYPAEGDPFLAAKLQDFFAWSPPNLLGGKVPLVLHLLAPNGRPCQITTDLETFWSGSYQQVRKDLRGRYPKHDWPENPGKETTNR